MTRCSYLDHDGKQCESTADETQALHLNGEIYSSIRDPFDPDNVLTELACWVAAPLCGPHAKAFDGNPVVGGVVN